MTQNESNQSDRTNERYWMAITERDHAMLDGNRTRWIDAQRRASLELGRGETEAAAGAQEKARSIFGY